MQIGKRLSTATRLPSASAARLCTSRTCHATGPPWPVSAGRPLVDQSLVMRRIGQQYPAGAAAFRLAHRGELRAPALDTAEIARNRPRQGTLRRAATAQTVKIGFVQDH